MIKVMKGFSPTDETHCTQHGGNERWLDAWIKMVG
jgi:hypothetical protein